MRVLITGSTSGIGEALAKQMESDGHEVIGVGRRSTATFQADLATQEGRNSVAQLIEEELPDIVVNNAGFGLAGPAIHHSVEEETSMIDVNVAAVLHLTLAAVKAWRKAGKRGTVMNVASIAGFITTPFSANYGASKAYVVSLSQSLDEELRGSGMRVLVACPGYIDTGFHKAASTHVKIKLPKRGVMTAEYAAKRIYEQILRQKQVLIFHWPYKFVPLLSRLLPRSLWLRLSRLGRKKTFAR